eukprot:10536842-Alexandrium_andersonii.AAC.1
MFIFYGGGSAKEYAGVGFVINLAVRRAIAFTDSRGPRAAVLGIDARPRQILVYSMCAPQSGREEDERRGFFEIAGNLMDAHLTQGVH